MNPKVRLSGKGKITKQQKSTVSAIAEEREGGMSRQNIGNFQDSECLLHTNVNL